MAISVPQTNASYGQVASPLTCSFSSLPSASNAVIVHVQLIGGTNAMSVTSVTDNQGVGNVYTRVNGAGDTSNYSYEDLWWCKSIGATSGTFTVSAVVTGTLSGGNCSLSIVEAAGGLNVVDKSSSFGSSSVVSSVTVTNASANTHANALVIGAVCGGSFGATNGVTTPPSTGYTSFAVVASGIPVSAGYKIVSSVETSSVTVSWTSGTQNASGVLASFANSGGGIPTAWWV